MSTPKITFFLPGLQAQMHPWQRKASLEAAALDADLQLCQFFGLDAKPSLAYLSAMADGLSPDKHYLRADPMALAVDLVHVYLIGNEHLQLSHEEANTYLSLLNANTNDFRMWAPHPLRWYLELNERPLIQTTSPAYALGKTIADTLPQGEERAKWLKYMTEWQMLLHECEINKERLQQNKASVDSLWLWGAGEKPALVRNNWNQIYTDCVLTRGLAALSFNESQLLQESKIQCHSAVAALPKKLLRYEIEDILKQAQGNVLISTRRFENCDPSQNNSDIFYNEWLKPLIHALRENKLSELTCYFANGQCLHWQGSKMWPWYKKALKRLLHSKPLIY